MFYTAEGCIGDTALTTGDPNVDCTKKATSGIDFQMMAIEHNGQPEAMANWYAGMGMFNPNAAPHGLLDYIPIETTDDCKAEGDEVFVVFSRSQEFRVDVFPPSIYGTSTPEAGFEVVITDNDGKLR